MADELELRAVLEFQGKRYTIVDYYEPDFSIEGADHHWKEGNYACDCNRSLFINRIDSTFPLMTCDKTIKLVSLEFIGDWKKTVEEC